MLAPLFGDTLFDSFFEDFAHPVRRTQGENQVAVASRFVMKTDVKENDKGFELHVELPGYKKEDVKVELKDGTLTISANSTVEEEKEEGTKFLRRERYIGGCSRSFYVGDDIDQSAISAKFENGVLVLQLPKKQPVEPEVRSIAIEG